MEKQTDIKYLEKLPKDLLIELALSFDLASLLNFCQSSKNINQIICENIQFWYRKLITDFNIYRKDIPKKYINNPKIYYEDIIYHLRNGINKFLIHYISENNINLVEYALNHGADLHIDNDSPLYKAVQNDNLDLVKYLVKKGADVNAGNGYILELALVEDNEDVAKYLIKKGADININNSEPFLQAIFSGNLDMIKYLVSKGANINAQNNKAFKLAYKYRYDDILNYLTSLL